MGALCCYGSKSKWIRKNGPKTKELKNQKHIAQWRSTLETYAYPVIGQKQVSEITKIDVLAILKPIWLTKNETANRLRGRIEAIIDYAQCPD